MKKKFKDYKNKIITMPNILSFFRLCLIPLIIWLYCVKQEYVWTFFVVGFSGLTDVVDGFIARRFNMISNFGKALDPIADKLTQLAMLVCLGLRFPWMFMLAAFLAAKELTTGIIATPFIDLTLRLISPCLKSETVIILEISVEFCNAANI